jgi:hypothetical protein
MDKNKIIMYVILGIVVLIMLDQILKAVGLKKDKADKDKDKAVENLRTNEYFDPLYYKGKAFSAIGKSPANQYAKDLHTAISGFGTDEETIYTTFGKLKCKYNISEIAESYYELYEKNLLPELLKELSEKEMATLNAVVNKLPDKM